MSGKDSGSIADQATGKSSANLSILGVALGILTAIGGFVDIGDLVTNAVVGSRFGISLVWVVVVGVVGICVFANMSGRVAARQRPGDVRDHPRTAGPAAGLANLAASFLINLMTLTAEIGGIALALQLASSVALPALDPGRGVRRMAGDLAGEVLDHGERHRPAGADPDRVRRGAVPAQARLGRPGRAGPAARGPGTTRPRRRYWYYAIALFGAAMTPYEVFFFSSGAVEEGWTVKDLVQSRINVLVGFPLGGLLSVAIAGCAAVVLLPQGIDGHLPVPGGAPGRGGRREDRARVRASSASSPRRSARRWRPRSPAATRSRSSSAGPGASSGGRRRPPAST